VTGSGGTTRRFIITPQQARRFMAPTGYFNADRLDGAASGGDQICARPPIGEKYDILSQVFERIDLAALRKLLGTAIGIALAKALPMG